MKNYLLIIAGFLMYIYLPAQTVGIGTNAPNSNAILDINSDSKGVLLPRLSDTTNVLNPSEGMIIYNQNTKAPGFYDGTRWASVLSSATAIVPDSITCTASSGLTTFTVKSIGQGVSNTVTVTNAADISITKLFDANSMLLQKLAFNRSFTTYFEFKFFSPGASIPYYSIKIYNVNVSAAQTSISSYYLEYFNFRYNRIGFKDWINNQSFGWDLAGNVPSSY